MYMITCSNLIGYFHDGVTESGHLGLSFVGCWVNLVL